MPKRPTVGLLDIFSGLPARSTSKDISRWLSDDSACRQTQLAARFTFNAAKQAKAIIRSECGKYWELNPDFYSDGEAEIKNPADLTRYSKYSEQNQELHAMFKDMTPRPFVELMAFISGEKVVDGRVSKDAYSKASKLWGRAAKRGILVKDDDNNWRYNTDGRR